MISSTNLNFIIIIPARMASARLPGKPLADIAGKTMIERVYNQALAADFAPVYIACDGEEIAREVARFGGQAIITDPALPSGTDRIFAALKKIESNNKNQKFDVIINLQGDLPNINPQIIKAAAQALIDSDADIGTIASVIKNGNENKNKNENEIANPNIVKIAIAFDGRIANLGQALYFSRAPIPHGAGEYYHHIGIYAYHRVALEKFISLPPSKLEKIESLEQLRALENGMSVAVSIVDSHPFSVDTKEDLEKINLELA